MNTATIRDGLAKLGIKRLLLAIHDTSFPSDPDEDIGRGSPATNAAARLFRYAANLGFTGVQLGPQGQTSRSNPSPYDGTIFSRNIANIGIASFRRGGPFAGLVDDDVLDRFLWRGGGRAQPAHAYDASHSIISVAHAALDRGARPDLRARVSQFAQAQYTWLLPDSLHAALCTERNTGFREWPVRDRELWEKLDLVRLKELIDQHGRAIDRYAFGQLLAHDEHQRVRGLCGVKLYGDMQIGYSDADAWRHQRAFLLGYLMGAPPSRTNPEGQPWGYPVLDPGLYDAEAGALVVARAAKAFAEYDSLRIDHPHGLVCPWVYRSDTGDPAQALRNGARLFESPDLDDHPVLGVFALVRPDQLDRTKPRYHDAWVTHLDDEQIERYSILLDAILDAAERAGRARADLNCEVLSTMPTPLGAVLARHGLGRFRVMQKANLDDATDVYRTENAAREDWVMLGNHDTPPIFAVIRGWSPAQREQWSRHLAARLKLRNPDRLVSARFAASAMLAELFVSRAENVSIFFADLFGVEERFNVPGVIDDTNWTLRLPPDFEALHASQLANENALDLPLAIELALAAEN